MSSVDVVQRQLEAYNAQNMEAFIATYAPDCKICDLNGDVTQNGHADIRARYAAMFAKFPENKARLVNRMTLGDVVIDHEDVTRGPSGPCLEAIAVYTVKNGLIARVDFIK
jgi:uncharacterized protein (TIGR02246 family)